MDHIDHGRKKARLFGLGAELLAAVLLMVKGYRILAWRYRSRQGEIDLVAWRAPVIAFVEVKARADLRTASEAISAEKVRRIAKTIDAWIARNPWCASQTLRGDAIFVGKWAWPKHIEDAYSIDIA